MIADAEKAGCPYSDRIAEVGYRHLCILRKYGSGILFVTAGVRRGKGKEVTLSSRKITRLRSGRGGSQFTPQTTYMDPAKYSGPLQAGHRAIEAKSKVLYSSLLGQFFGEQTKKADPRPFVAEAFSQTAQSVVSYICDQAPAMIEREYAAVVNALVATEYAARL